MRWPVTPTGRRTLGQVVAYAAPFPVGTLVLIIHVART